MIKVVKSYYTLILPPLSPAPDYYSSDHEVKLGSFNSEKEAHEFMEEKGLSKYPYEVRLITIP